MCSGRPAPGPVPASPAPGPAPDSPAPGPAPNGPAPDSTAPHGPAPDNVHGRQLTIRRRRTRASLGSEVWGRGRGTLKSVYCNSCSHKSSIFVDCNGNGKEKWVALRRQCRKVHAQLYSAHGERAGLTVGFREDRIE